MFDLQEFIAECRAAESGADALAETRDRIAAAFQDPDSIRTALRGADPDGRNAVLHASEDLTVLHVVTQAGFVSPIHNHLMWAAIGILDGAERNFFYRRTEPDGIELVEERVLSPDSGIFVLRADRSHAIRAEGGTAVEGLHVYGGDLLRRSSRSMWHPETLAEQPYDYTQLMIWASRMRRGIPL